MLYTSSLRLQGGFGAPSSAIFGMVLLFLLLMAHQLHPVLTQPHTCVPRGYGLTYGLRPYMYQPPACCTYRRRRAACPRGPRTVRKRYTYQPRPCCRVLYGPHTVAPQAAPHRQAQGVRCQLGLHLPPCRARQRVDRAGRRARLTRRARASVGGTLVAVRGGLPRRRQDDPPPAPRHAGA